MKTTSPLNWVRLASLALATMCTANAATYSLDLRSEVHPGKYLATPDASLTGQLGAYASVATTGTFGNSDWSFWTFCLERAEFFQSGKTYGADISATKSATKDSDIISKGTAYLYQQFAMGNLSTLVTGFSYTNVADGGERLQNTIWGLEGEFGASSHTHLDTELETLLLNEFGSQAAYLSDYTGTSVGVLNLTKFSGTNGDSLSGTARQDQLFYRGGSENIPPPSVPDGGTTLLLLGLSLGGLRIASRFQKS